VLKNMHRATIVGGTTAGAGHNNANLDIGEGFNASISFTRVMDPKTGASGSVSASLPTCRWISARARRRTRARAQNHCRERRRIRDATRARPDP
jgi:hypothetical protein